MPKIIKPLTDRTIKSEIKKNAKTIPDGSIAGLALYKKKDGYVWRFRYKLGNKRSYYTIGDYPLISLKEARAKAGELKKLLSNNIDPNIQKQKEKQELIKKQNKKTFQEIVNEFLMLKKETVSPERYKKNYKGRFDKYILPNIKKRYIEEITRDDIISLIKKIPSKNGKVYTAKDVFNIIKQLFDFAVHSNYIEYNFLQGIKISKILPKHKEEHRDAITNKNELRQLYKDILNYPNELLSKTMQFQALTALRNVGLYRLKWEYIKWDEKIIIYPIGTYKDNQQEYRLPLTNTLIDILKFMKQIHYKNEFVFLKDTHSTENSFSAYLLFAYYEMGYKNKHSPHGWRSSLRTLTMETEKREFDFDIIEAQLNHKIGSNVERPYIRTDLMQLRYKLLEWWEEFLTTKD
jgi:integrase